MKFLKYTLFSIFILSMGSCINKDREPLKPTPSGAPGDVLLVVSNRIWDSYGGDTLRSMLAGPVEALPQNEPRFNVIRIEYHALDKNFKTQRNIIIVKVGHDQEESKVLYQRDLWAKTQLLISIITPNEDSLINLLNTNREEIIALLDNAERSRLIKAYHNTLDQKIYNTLKQEHNILLTVPKGFDIDVDREDFVWLSQEYRDIIQGILIYTYDYTDPETFTRDYLAKKRDYFTKKYVPGEIEGSYMQIEPLFPPLFRQYRLRNKTYTAELRGLWRMQEGLAMGGPFVSITQLDEKRNKVVTADAFVFAPGHEKRELLRQLEAIILSMEITDPAGSENK